MLREAYFIIIIKLYIFYGAFNKPNLHMYLRIYVKFKSKKICLYHAYSPITIERVRELFQQPSYIILKYVVNQSHISKRIIKSPQLAYCLHFNMLLISFNSILYARYTKFSYQFFNKDDLKIS